MQLQPDVMVADISMPKLNGLEAVAQLRHGGCQAKVVFLTKHKDVTYAAKALEVGASGFVLKHSASTELLAAIRAAISGTTYVTSEIAERLQELTSYRTAMIASPSLTPRQREVLQLFAEGRSAKEVAAALHISTRTAENHKARIMTLLSLSTTADLVQFAIRHGIITAE
jgi:DNA-binding NarL/FixJ family response regulator